MVGCPSRDELTGWLLGRVAGERSEEILAHVDTCPDCHAELETLDEQADDLVRELRGGGSGPDYEVEPEFARAVPALVSLADEFRASAPVPHTAILRRIREYELLEPLGSGGMGTVYKARHTRLDRLVAIKLIAPQQFGNAAAVARFQQEMRAIGRLSNPHLLTATDAGEHDGIHFLVTEYVPGVTLSRLVEQTGPLPIAECCEIGRQVALGLEYIHRQGLVHRDIKPSNLMLALAGKLGSDPAPAPIVKILDLGLARWQIERDPSSEPVTGSGQIIGTVDYIAPEQASDPRSVDIRADLYSLGCTLYKLITGHVPFEHDRYPTALSALSAHRHDEPKPLAEYREVPEELAASIHKLLAKCPTQRFQLLTEAAAALAPLAEGADLMGLLGAALRPRLLAQQNQSTFSAADARVGTGSGLQTHTDPMVPTASDQQGGTFLPLEDGEEFADLPRTETACRAAGTVPTVDRRRVKLACTVAALLLFVGVPTAYQVIVRIKDRQGKPIAELAVEPGGTAELATEALSKASPAGTPLVARDKKPGPVDGTSAAATRKGDPVLPPSAIGADVDRRAAEWVLSLNGLVTIWQPRGERNIANSADLPRDRFLLVRIDLGMDDKSTAFGDRSDKNLLGIPVPRSGEARTTEVTDASLQCIGGLTNLRALWLEGAPITDAGLKYLEGLTNLTTLSLSRTYIRDAGLEHLQRMTDLQTLNLRKTPIGDAGVAHLRGLRNLKTLNLDNTRVSDAGLECLKGLTSLTALRLQSARVTDAGLEHLKSLHNLQRLGLGATSVTDAGLEHLRGLTSLTALLLYNTSVTDAGLVHLRGLDNLEWLSIGNNPTIIGSGLVHVKELRNLKHLNVSNTRIGDRTLEPLAALSTLEENVIELTDVSRDGYESLLKVLPNVRLRWSNRHYVAAERVFASSGRVRLRHGNKVIEVRSAEGLPRGEVALVGVDLTGARNTPPELWDALYYVGCGATLESLDLAGSSVRDADWAFLAGLSTVTDLSLARTALTDAALKPLEEWKELRRLDLEGTAIVGSGLRNLVWLVKLEELRLGCPQLSDAPLCHVAKLTSLKRLSLAGSGITDAGLAPLAALTQLEELDLSRTAATAAARDKLQQALPRCKVRYEQR